MANYEIIASPAGGDILKRIDDKKSHLRKWLFCF
jgi:hypothetical protein